MVPHPHGSWEHVNPRARKIFRRGQERRRRKDQSAAHRLRKGKHDVRYSFEISSEDGPLSFLFEEISRITLHALTSRKMIDKVRRRQARDILPQTLKLRIIRRRTESGAYVIIPGQQYDDFWVPIRESECRVLDAWQWVMRYEPWQQKMLLEVKSIYSNISRAQLVSLITRGETRYYSPRVRVVILIEVVGQSFNAHPLNPVPLPDNDPQNSLDDGRLEMDAALEKIGAEIAA